MGRIMTQKRLKTRLEPLLTRDASQVLGMFLFLVLFYFYYYLYFLDRLMLRDYSDPAPPRTAAKAAAAGQGGEMDEWWPKRRSRASSFVP